MSPNIYQKLDKIKQKMNENQKKNTDKINEMNAKLSVLEAKK